MCAHEVCASWHQGETCLAQSFVLHTSGSILFTFVALINVQAGLVDVWMQAACHETAYPSTQLEGSSGIEKKPAAPPLTVVEDERNVAAEAGAGGSIGDIPMA